LFHCMITDNSLKGVLAFANKDVYDGEWKAGKQDGTISIDSL
jgi:hypothetical protein